MYMSNNVIKYGLGYVAIACVTIGMFNLSSGYYEDRRMTDGIANVSQHEIKESSPAQDFIGVCSGMDLTHPDVHVVALSECMGRVRGFVDGHNLTIAIVQITDNSKRANTMWCMPTQVSTGQLLTDIMDWVDQNPNEYVKIRSNVDDDNSATAVMIQALRTTYPCANT